ncbi:hypothetical protein BKA67DRAFT_660178 [Truncatella angustata]|uniref:Uncharacterized protein n=1 Tax=Truncatella angustata TaxID=152316 RepID=A0A9P8ZX07_9PEZI|nr:uncharacterized protein BKA67DRAFT_660178 [Truncatella angustata]KAH6653596.1 hypothetical protein BKA67DRAFT_660178 [Truncatella angustata]
MLYVSEYKAPHKRTAPHLRVGLHPMDIFKDVVNRKTIPAAADPDGRFQYHAERLTAAAITQTYNYMIEGECAGFLPVYSQEYNEVAAQSGEHHACTAVGQYLAFSLMALGPPGNPPNVRSQDERQRVILGLRRWAEDLETTLRYIPRDERYAPSGSSSGSLYAPTTYAGISRSPRVPRTRPSWAQEEDRPDVQPRCRDRDDESSSDKSSAPMPDTPTPSEPRSSSQSQGPRRSQRILGRAPREETSQERQYCTQRCLLGLVRRGTVRLVRRRDSLHSRLCAAIRLWSSNRNEDIVERAARLRGQSSIEPYGAPYGRYLTVVVLGLSGQAPGKTSEAVRKPA